MDSRTEKLMNKVLEIGLDDKEGMLSIMEEIGRMGKPKKSKGPKFTADSKGNVTKNYAGGGCVMKGRGGSFKGTN